MVIDLAEAWWHFVKCRFYCFFVYRAEILLASVLLYYLHQLILVGGIYFICINQGEDM